MKEAKSTSRVVTIQITEEDIRKGIPKNCEFCPVALAIKRYLQPGICVGVNLPLITFRINIESEFLIYQEKLPQEKFLPHKHAQEEASKVWNFIYSFDRRFKVWPFSFLLVMKNSLLKERTK